MEQNEFMDTPEVAKLTGLSIHTFKNHRKEGKGLPYIKLGRKVFYNRQVVMQYLKTRQQVSV
jgi:predicted DNA-binding transcriptional regulator AlpA